MTSKQQKGWLWQRIQAILRNSNLYYSEEILFSLVLCLVSGNKHLILRVAQDSIPALSHMIEEISQDTFGLSQVTLHCDSTTTLENFISTLLNKSRENFVRPRATSLVRSIASTHKTISADIQKGSIPVELEDCARKSSLLPNENAEKRGRSVSVGEKILEKGQVYRNKVEMALTRTDQPWNKDAGDLYLVKDQISVSFKEPFRSGEHLATSNIKDSNDVINAGFVTETITMNMSPTSSIRRYRPMSSDFKVDPQLNSRRASSNIYTSYYSQPLKRIANVILIEGIQNSQPILNAGIAEFLRNGWFTEANNVYHLPDPCIVIMLLPMEAPSPLPRDIFFLNFSIEGSLKQKPKVQPKRMVMLNYHELREISHKMKHIKISPEVSRYVKDVVLHIRMNPAFRTGLNAKAAADLITAVKAIAAILEQNHITPGIIFMMIKKVLGHRIHLNQNRRASRIVKPEDIIMESLRLVRPPI